MQRFQYQATNSLGEKITGEIQADSLDDAHRQLVEKELTVETVNEVTSGSRGIDAPEQILELVEQVKEVTATGIPLVVTLRSFQEESPPGKTSQLLGRLCDNIEQGVLPAEAMLQGKIELPTTLFYTCRCRDFSPKHLGHILGEYLKQTRHKIQLKRELLLGLFYPIVLSVSVGCLLLFVMAFLVPEFKSLFIGFGMDLPGITKLVLSISDFVLLMVSHWYLLLFGLGLVIAIWVSLIPVFGWDRRWKSNLFHFIPVFGTSQLLMALADFCQMMALLIEHRVPLPVAVRIAAESTDDLPLIRQAKKMEQLFEQGAGYDEVSSLLETYPQEFQHAFCLMGRGHVMAEAMRSTGKVYSSQAKTTVDLLSVITGPLMVCLIGISIGFIVFSLFSPMIDLLNNLS